MRRIVLLPDWGNVYLVVPTLLWGLTLLLTEAVYTSNTSYEVGVRHELYVYVPQCYQVEWREPGYCVFKKTR